MLKQSITLMVLSHSSPSDFPNQKRTSATKKLKEVETKIRKSFGDTLLDAFSFRGELTIVVKNQRLVEFFHYLREDEGLAFNVLVDITGVDYLNYPDAFPSRFAVVYHLHSWKTEVRIRIKVAVEGDLVVPTLVPIWDAANWLEREVYDMFGITFNGHPDHRRILTWDDCTEHPLRKDYPLKGKGEREGFEKIERGFTPKHYLRSWE